MFGSSCQLKSRLQIGHIRSQISGFRQTETGRAGWPVPQNRKRSDSKQRLSLCINMGAPPCRSFKSRPSTRAPAKKNKLIYFPSSFIFIPAMWPADELGRLSEQFNVHYGICLSYWRDGSLSSILHTATNRAVFMVGPCVYRSSIERMPVIGISSDDGCCAR